MLKEIKALLEKIHDEGRIDQAKADSLLNSIEDSGRLVIGSDEDVIEVLL